MSKEGYEALSKDYFTEGVHCPHCGVLNDGASGLNTPDKPTPGAFSVCAKCGEIGVYFEHGNEVGLRKPQDHELVDLMCSRGWTVIETIQSFIKYGKRIREVESDKAERTKTEN